MHFKKNEKKKKKTLFVAKIKSHWLRLLFLEYITIHQPLKTENIRFFSPLETSDCTSNYFHMNFNFWQNLGWIPWLNERMLAKTFWTYKLKHNCLSYMVCIVHCIFIVRSTFTVAKLKQIPRVICQIRRRSANGLYE